MSTGAFCFHEKGLHFGGGLSSFEARGWSAARKHETRPHHPEQTSSAASAPLRVTPLTQDDETKGDARNPPAVPGRGVSASQRATTDTPTTSCAASVLPVDLEGKGLVGGRRTTPPERGTTMTTQTTGKLTIAGPTAVIRYQCPYCTAEYVSASAALACEDACAGERGRE